MKLVLILIITLSIIVHDVRSQSDIEVDYEKGISQLRAGNFYDAVFSFNSYIIDFPDSSKGYLQRGIAFYNIDKLTDAEKDLSKALELSPTDPAVHNMLGLLFGKLKYDSRSIEEFDKAILINSEFAEAYNNRGIAYGNMKEFPKALVDLTIAIKIDPAFAEAYYNRGYIYIELNDYKEAIKDFTKLITLEPANAMAYVNRGMSYYLSAQYETAIKDFQKAKLLDASFSKDMDEYIKKTREIIKSKKN
jgi:tetratricopeptide (TPR) repeat protein